MVLEWKYKNVVKTIITVDLQNEKISIENQTNDIFERAFGVNTAPNFQDFQDLIKSRCFSENSGGLKLKLNELGLPYYNNLSIISKTKGILEGDHFSLEITEE